MEVHNRLSFAHLMKLMVRYWQWFLPSVVICLCVSLLYIHFATPVYKISGRMIIRQTDNYKHTGSTKMLKNVSNIGQVTNTSGVENEVEMLWSSTLMRDVATSLKLYTEYRVKDWPKSRLV